MYVSKYCALEDGDILAVCKYFKVINSYEHTIFEDKLGHEVVRYDAQVVKSAWNKAMISSALELDVWRRALKNRLFKVFGNDVTLDKIENCLFDMGFEKV